MQTGHSQGMFNEHGLQNEQTTQKYCGEVLLHRQDLEI
jgi:hypothetical protein